MVLTLEHEAPWCASVGGPYMSGSEGFLMAVGRAAGMVVLACALLLLLIHASWKRLGAVAVAGVGLALA